MVPIFRLSKPTAKNSTEGRSDSSWGNNGLQSVFSQWPQIQPQMGILGNVKCNTPYLFGSQDIPPNPREWERPALTEPALPSEGSPLGKKPTSRKRPLKGLRPPEESRPDLHVEFDHHEMPGHHVEPEDRQTLTLWPNWILITSPKSLWLNTVTLGTGASTYDFFRDTNSP